MKRIVALICFGALVAGAAAPQPSDVPADAEVWLCAGQSNMAWPLRNCPSAKAEAARTASCDVRLHDFRTGAWTRITPANAGGVSAIALMFATRRAAATGRPQALLYVAAGGAPTEAFLSRKTMCAKDASGKPRFPHLARIAANTNTLDRNLNFPCLWCRGVFAERQANKWEGRLWAVSAMNGAIAAAQRMPLAGVLWYQGETNASTNVQPDTALPQDYVEETLRAVVEDLAPGRRCPVFMFGLPKMNRPWEVYRAAQKKVCEETGNVYLDTFGAGLGTPNNVHPPEKIPFAELAVAAAAARVRGVDLFRSGMTWQEKRCAICRIPAICRAPGGTLLAACDMRPDNVGDLNAYQAIRIAVRRSTDNGRTWSAPAPLHNLSWTPQEKLSASDPSFLVDRVAKKVFCFWNAWEFVKDRGHYRLYVQHSADDGATWSAPREITDSVHRPEWNKKSFVFCSSGHGVQLRDGTLLHTLVWVNRHQVGLFGSPDHGVTWQSYGSLVGPGDECKVEELKDGAWMINTRLPRGGARGVHVSRDHGATWTTRIDKALSDPACNGALLRLADGRLAFSNCDVTRGPRRNVSVRVSTDEGATWSRPRVVDAAQSEYSDLVELANGEVGIIYEKGPGFKSIRFENLGKIP